MIDLAVSGSILLLLALAGVAFAVVSLKNGRRRFERVEREGQSALLGKNAMELAHFTLEPIGRACARAGISANAITFVSLVLGVATGVAIATAHYGVAAGLSTVSALCDSLDGMVARMTNTSSDAGETFDAAVDRYNEFFFLGGLAYVFRAHEVLLVLVLAALLGSFMVSYSTAKAEALHVTPPRGSMRRAERATYLTLGVLFVPFAALAAPPAAPLVALSPIIVALLLVAVVGNVSAARRIFAIAELVRARERGAQLETARQREPEPELGPEAAPLPSAAAERRG